MRLGVRARIVSREKLAGLGGARELLAEPRGTHVRALVSGMRRAAHCVDGGFRQHTRVF
jgi:hypothetical protein|tara:strand:- start:431 stop:607 length:177 start_codon:yes stop_codon:yes gene_type:complete